MKKEESLDEESLDQAVQRFRAALRAVQAREGEGTYKVARKGATLYVVARTPGRGYSAPEYR